MTTTYDVEDLIDYDFDEENSLLRAKYTHDQPQIDAGQAKAIIDLRRQVTRHLPHRLLMFATSLDGFTSEAQAVLFGPDGMDGITSIALLYTPSTQPIAEAIEKSPDNKIPVKAFPANEIAAAEEWLLQQAIA